MLDLSNHGIKHRFCHPFRRHQDPKVIDRKKSSVKGKDGTNTLGNPLVEPRQKIGHRLGEVRGLTSKFAINGKVEINIPGNPPRSMRDKNKVVSIHKMVEVTPQIRIKTRDRVLSQGKIKHRGKVLRNKNKKVRRYRVTLSNTSSRPNPRRRNTIN